MWLCQCTKKQIIYENQKIDVVKPEPSKQNNDEQKLYESIYNTITINNEVREIIDLIIEKVIENCIQPEEMKSEEKYIDFDHNVDSNTDSDASEEKNTWLNAITKKMLQNNSILGFHPLNSYNNMFGLKSLSLK